MNATELKTWADKNPKNILRVKIMVPKGKKLREVYYYTADLFEAELVKIEIEKRVFNHLREDIHTANEIFRANIAQNISNQMKLAPGRKSNWEKISAVAENYPDKFAEAMANFGQKLVDKAKAMIAPKNKWLFDFRNLKEDVNNGKKGKNNIKVGQILVDEKYLQFINPSRPQDNFEIKNYDDLHAILCYKDGGNYMVNFKGRKIKTLLEDSKDVQDPMETL
jgi:hypothetical protein